MGVQIDVVYEGQLHTVATHGPSGKTLTTDAPKDNMGKGESFSPTDLVATALGTCLVTIMGIVAQRNGLDIAGTRVHVEKEMAQAPLRRIARLPVTITVPKEQAAKISADDRQKMEKAARTCPVHASLHPEIDAPVTFVYES
ncbi:MAG: OsmC family protein [Planctomycetes bacterium]|nr:OsmC family protein [Planctomycetota bacterium]